MSNITIDNQNLHEYERVKQLYGTDRIGFAYTGLADDFNKLKADGLKTDIFFNIYRGVFRVSWIFDHFNWSSKRI